MLPRELRQYSNRKVFITIGAVVGLSFITTAATVVALSALLLYRQGAQNYNDSRVDLEQLSAHLLQSSTLVREFIITDSQGDLGLYRQSVDNVHATLDQVQQVVTPVAYRAEVDALRPMVETVLGEQNRVLSIYNSGDAAGARAALDTGTELADYSRVEAQVAQIEGGDVSQLASDRQRINSLAQMARNISLASLVITLALALTVYYLYLKGIQAERRLDRAKDEFVSLASHQLRTPATGVKTILATLVAGDLGVLSERQQHFAQKALDSNERGLDIIEELLNVAKADAGRLVLNPTSFDIVNLVRSLVAEQQPHIESDGLQLSLKLPDEPVMVTADRDKLYMAIGNLVDNARKYTPGEGSVSVSLNNRSRDVRLTVADTGAGIAKADLPHIFERFGRSSDAQSTHVEGTGLGLYLVKRIIQLHRGRITVASRRGKGSKFVMIIPRQQRQLIP